MQNALVVSSVTKTFTKKDGSLFTAVDDVSFTIAEGTIHGLLGPNGAGKSTLINMISGAMSVGKGEITVFGIDVMKDAEAAKMNLSIVPQEIVVEMAFTVKEVLWYFSGMYGVPMNERNARIDSVLTDLDLLDKRDERARGLSGGMKRRLMIAKAMISKPKFLILDEPTAGVDVALRQKIWEVVRRMNKEGTTILFTTHYLEEAEQLCENITLMNHGKKIKDGKLKDIQQEFSKNVIHFELFSRDAAHLDGVMAIGTEYEYPMTDLGKDIAKITSHYKGNIKSIRNEAASLEQIFLTLTK